VRNAIAAALAGLLIAAAAANAQIGAGATPPSDDATIPVPPGATAGALPGPAIGSTRPYYRDYAHRDRVCWHDRGYRQCRWR
jgi:hypothetical protein